MVTNHSQVSKSRRSKNSGYHSYRRRDEITEVLQTETLAVIQTGMRLQTPTLANERLRHETDPNSENVEKPEAHYREMNVRHYTKYLQVLEGWQKS